MNHYPENNKKNGYSTTGIPHICHPKQKLQTQTSKQSDFAIMQPLQLTVTAFD
jgi:hypothetical protein